MFKEQIKSIKWGLKHIWEDTMNDEEITDMVFAIRTKDGYVTTLHCGTSSYVMRMGMAHEIICNISNDMKTVESDPLDDQDEDS
jgi:hypothetical protein